MAESGGFVYDDLPGPSEADSHAIRLLRIHTIDTGAAQLQCSLETHDYETCPGYWALSYTWGPEAPSHIILVNGRPFRVRQNLFDFMKMFRSPGNAEFYLWIDQLCINQDNIPERNDQVCWMGEYYSRATCVLTWLGVGTDVEAAAMAAIQCVDVENLPPPTERKEPLTLGQLEGYRAIIANPYFERLWIVQEMTRARNILVVMGTGSDGGAIAATWRHFYVAFMQIVFERRIGSKTAAAAQKEIMLRQEIRDRSKILFQLLELKKNAADAIDILDLIEAFGDFKCADPRDKLYALKDIGRRLQQRELFANVDYGKSRYQVYGDFLTGFLELARASGRALGDRHLDVLMRLAEAMDVKLEVQKMSSSSRPDDDDDDNEDGSPGLPPSHDSRGGESDSDPASASTVTAARSGDVEMLQEAMSYVASTEIRVFGPRYDDQGRRVSPFAADVVQGRIPNVFDVPASVDMEEMVRLAYGELGREWGVDKQALGHRNRNKDGEDKIVEDGLDSDGYRTIMMLSGDISRMRRA